MLAVSFDAYVQPDAQVGRPAVTRLVVDDEEVARVAYRTSSGSEGALESPPIG